MSVFREATIEWKGETYTFTPSMRLLRTIEQEVSIAHCIHAVAQGKAKISHMAFFVAAVMQAAGARVTEDEIYQELASAEAKEVQALFFTLADIISPAPKEQKKSG